MSCSDHEGLRKRLSRRDALATAARECEHDRGYAAARGGIGAVLLLEAVVYAISITVSDARMGAEGVLAEVAEAVSIGVLALPLRMGSLMFEHGSGV